MSGLSFNALAASLYSKQVTHVRLSNAFFLGKPEFEHIVALKGPGWEKAREDVVADVIGGTPYYVDNDAGPRAYLEAMLPKTMLGSPYVRTKPDCTQANNLLSLPRF
jgi:hypothetical protein